LFTTSSKILSSSPNCILVQITILVFFTQKSSSVIVKILIRLLQIFEETSSPRRATV